MGPRSVVEFLNDTLIFFGNKTEKPQICIRPSEETMAILVDLAKKFKKTNPKMVELIVNDFLIRLAAAEKIPWPPGTDPELINKATRGLLD